MPLHAYGWVLAPLWPYKWASILKHSYHTGNKSIRGSCSLMNQGLASKDFWKLSDEWQALYTISCSANVSLHVTWSSNSVKVGWCINSLFSFRHWIDHNELPIQMFEWRALVGNTTSSFPVHSVSAHFEGVQFCTEPAVVATIWRHHSYRVSQSGSVTSSAGLVIRSPEGNSQWFLWQEPWWNTRLRVRICLGLNIDVKKGRGPRTEPRIWAQGTILKNHSLRKIFGIKQESKWLATVYSHLRRLP